MALRMRRLCDRIATFPAPVIAALNGHALGGGAEVAVAADIRVAAADVTIGFNQSRLAIMPAWGGAERLAGRIAASPSRSIKSVIAAAAPHHHPGLEETAAATFADLWVADAHWAAADGLTAKS